MLSRALDEVSTGRSCASSRACAPPSVAIVGRQAGAAQDLKKLHDLMPADVKVMEELRDLTRTPGLRGMVQLDADQILRGKDPASRAELARKVRDSGRSWTTRAKRRILAAVLRMKSGDPSQRRAGARQVAEVQRRVEPPNPPSRSRPSPFGGR